MINPLNIRSDAANKSNNLRKSAAKLQLFFHSCKYFYKKNTFFSCFFFFLLSLFFGGSRCRRITASLAQPRFPPLIPLTILRCANSPSRLALLARPLGLNADVTLQRVVLVVYLRWFRAFLFRAFFAFFVFIGDVAKSNVMYKNKSQIVFDPCFYNYNKSIICFDFQGFFIRIVSECYIVSELKIPNYFYLTFRKPSSTTFCKHKIKCGNICSYSSP